MLVIFLYQYIGKMTLERAKDNKSLYPEMTGNCMIMDLLLFSQIVLR